MRMLEIRSDSKVQSMAEHGFILLLHGNKRTSHQHNRRVCIDYKFLMSLSHTEPIGIVIQTSIDVIP